MLEVRKTAQFAAWIEALRDRQAVARINIRIARLALGHPGDAKSVGGNIREMRLDFGPGYRIYFTQRDRQLIVLLCGGDKATQRGDIALAKQIEKDL